MHSLAKLSHPDLDVRAEFTHPNVWQREEYPAWSRLRIGARRGEIPLILELCSDLNGPFGVLWVLLVSHRNHEPGRYQNPEPVTHHELEPFLHRFQDFFEQDGRHHLWVQSLAGDGQLVFDNHNMIYAYGDLARYEARLTAAGFRPGAVEIPAPHVHHFNAEFDQAEDDLMSHWEWKQFPLQESDDP